MKGVLDEVRAQMAVGKIATAVGFVVAFLIVEPTSALQTTDPEGDGEWSTVFDWSALVSPTGFDQELAHAALLSTGMHAGKVLLHNYFDGDGTTRCWLVNPDSPAELIEINLTPKLKSDIFCGGMTFRSDGTLPWPGAFHPREPHQHRTRATSSIREDLVSFSPAARPRSTRAPGSSCRP